MMLSENWKISDNRQSYQMSGYATGKFKDSENFKKFFNIMERLHNDLTPPDGFNWESKYQNTLDLRPSVYEMDSVFLEVLAENQILEKAKVSNRLRRSRFITYSN